MYSFNLEDIKKDENFPKNLNVLEFDYLVNENLNKPNSIKLLETDYNFFNNINDDINDYLYNAIFISTANGEDLDRLGDNLQLSRNSGESDSDYRDRLLSFKALFSGYAYVQKILDYYNIINESINFWYKYFFIKRKNMFDNSMNFDLYGDSNLEENLANGIPLLDASTLNYTFRVDLDPSLETLPGGSTYSPQLDSDISALVLNDYVVLDFVTQTEINNANKIFDKIAKICSRFIITPTIEQIPDYNWNLQETVVGAVEDTGFIGNNGTNTNCTVGNSGVSTSHVSYYFNGTAYLKFENIPSFHNIFYSFWLKTTNSSGSILNIVDLSGNLDFELVLNTGLIRLNIDRFEGSPLQFDSTTAVNDGSWHHIVLKMDNNYIYLYIDNSIEFQEEKSNTYISKWNYTSKEVQIYKGVSYEGLVLNNYINNTYIENIQLITNPLSRNYVTYYYNEGEGRLL